MKKQNQAICLGLFFFLTVLINMGFMVGKVYAAPQLFGTIEFRAAKDKIPAWMEVLKKQEASSFFKTRDKWRGSFEAFKAKYESLAENVYNQLSLVNLYWNQFPYREDIHNYKMEDYWASIDEMVKNSGDCEDYAIAKFYTLKELGYPTDQMRIVVVQEMTRNIAHAVLAVYDGDEIYILDNLSNRIYTHDFLTNYDPRFSVNEEWRWVHMRPKKK